MADYGAWGGIGRAMSAGGDAYQRARQARLAEEADAKREAQQESSIGFQQGKSMNHTMHKANLGAYEKKNALPPGFMLKPGERYNPQTDTVEAIPGSDLYQAQSGKHIKDLRAITSVRQKTDAGVSAIKKFLERPENVESQFGRNYSGLASRYLNPNARAQLETIRNNFRSVGLDRMRQGGSIGMMTESEWPMVEKLLGNLSNTQSEQEGKSILQQAAAEMERIRRDAEELYKTEWADTPYGKQAQMTSHAAADGPKPGDVDSGYRFKGGDPADQNSWEQVR